MYARDTSDDAFPPERDALQRQVRQLEERLAFYEGFDSLIQDNVTHARELFRLASQERAAAGAADRDTAAAAEREAALRRELESLSTDLAAISGAVNALAQRVSDALNAAPRKAAPEWAVAEAEPTEQAVAVVVHGIPTARAALSLQRFMTSLPQVKEVSAREFVDGVLRLDARVQERLQVEHFRDWAEARRIHALTEGPDVVEFALEGQGPVAELLRA